MVSHEQPTLSTVEPYAPDPDPARIKILLEYSLWSKSNQKVLTFEKKEKSFAYVIDCKRFILV